MRFSPIAVASLATLAVASPIDLLKKKAIIWDIVTDYVWVTVTANAAGQGQAVQTTHHAKPDTTVTVQHTHYTSYEPAPAPTSSVVVVPTPSTSSTPAAVVVAPTTLSTSSTTPPAPAPTTSSTSTTPVVEVAAVTTSASAVASTTSSIVAPVENVVAAAATPTDFASYGTYYHNKHRSNHSASDVTWDANLASYAQTLADTCNFHHDQSIGGGGYGQNIDSQGMSGTSVAESVPLWNSNEVLANAITNNWYYAEEPAFPYGVATPTEGATQLYHFSQIVWKTTTTIGCAATYCDTRILPGNYGWFVVCNYGPAGNYVGEFATDVTPQIGQPAIKVAVPWA